MVIIRLVLSRYVKNQGRRPRFSKMAMTSSCLEHHLHNFMKEGTLGADTLADIKKTMGNIWQKTKTFPGADP